MGVTSGQILLAQQACNHLNAGLPAVLQIGPHAVVVKGDATVDEKHGRLKVQMEGGEELNLNLEQLVWMKLLPPGTDFNLS